LFVQKQNERDREAFVPVGVAWRIVLIEPFRNREIFQGSLATATSKMH
jgi:hypothetical protein